ncbi:MAG: hypothetical protein WCA01_04480 [Burkholderiales bacterium]
MRHVVAVCGPIGGGKTSVVRGLVRLLGDAVAIHMDSYERMTSAQIDDVARWAERGADVEQLPVPLLAEHLRALRRGETVADPARGAPIAPRKYIVLETQFGRQHQSTGEQIDLLIWIDTPLDLALARKLKAFTDDALRERAEAGRERLAWLDGYLANYLALVRRLMLLQAARVRPQADIVLDGSGELEAIVREARLQVLRSLP